MFFSSRIRLKPLAQLCHRLAISTGAGVKDLKIWQGEAERGSRSQQHQIQQIATALSGGSTLSQAIATTGKYFPKLFRQMVEVGDVSGQTDRTYKRLAEHFDRTLAAKKAFLGQLAWPMFQLGMAAAVVGLLILIMGMLPVNQGDGPGFDLLGLGLMGMPGFIKYCSVLTCIAMVVLMLVEAVRRGAGFTAPLQRAVVMLPVVGNALKTLALARFTWAFQLVLGTSMDLRKALPLVLDATGNDYYSRWGPEVAIRIEQGQDIHDALQATGIFPQELLDNLAVGEESGRLAETMQRLSKEYQERANSAVSLLAQVAGYLIWLFVAGMIIMLIFQLFSGYLGIIEDAGKPI